MKTKKTTHTSSPYLIYWVYIINQNFRHYQRPKNYVETLSAFSLIVIDLAILMTTENNGKKDHVNC